MKNRLLAISSFSSRYAQMCEKQKSNLGIRSWGGLTNDWWLALRFFFDRAFFQGRKDRLSECFEDAALQAVESVLGTSNETRTARLWKLYQQGFLAKEKWDEPGNTLTQALKKKYLVDDERRGTGKEGDRRMVIDTFRFICDKAASDKEPLNLVQYIIQNVKAGKIPAVAEELDSIWQIGPKIYSLILRDTIDFFGLCGYVSSTDFKHLQPIDTWVRQLAEKLDVKGEDSEISVGLCELCAKHGIDPIKFNQGAWYLAAHSFQIIFENVERLRS